MTLVRIFMRSFPLENQIHREDLLNEKGGVRKVEMSLEVDFLLSWAFHFSFYLFAGY